MDCIHIYYLFLAATLFLQNVSAKPSIHRGRCSNRVFHLGGFCKRLEDCDTLSQTQKQDLNLIEDLSCVTDSNDFICCPKSNSIISLSQIQQLLPAPTHCGQIVIGDKIFGGTETVIDEFAWMAILLYEEENNLCGGTIIAQRWVLTAAHCVHNRHVRGVRLGEWNIETNPDCQKDRLGNLDCAPPHIEIDVLYSIAHPEFVAGGNYAHDIALLYLAEPLVFSDWIKAICLPLASVNVNGYAGLGMDIAGWGRYEGSLSGSKQMLKASVSVWLKESCQAIFARNQLHKRQLCAGNISGSCSGDSGGPLMQRRNQKMFQVGVISTGGNCKAEHRPVVFTKVDDYMHWIGFEMAFLESLHIN